MGHTTRCIPLIRYLLQQDHLVTFAGNTAQCQLILQNVPNISTTLLDGYNVRYNRRPGNFIFTILKQLPHLARTIKREHRWLLDFLAKNSVDGIISDNRYGLHHSTIPCAILTHQPAVKTGMGTFADALVRKLHYFFLAKFGQVWLVDHPGNDNLSGELAHPKALPEKARYIGLLSQMTINRDPAQEKHLLILLSGPEPQRTLLQDILLEAAKKHNGKVVFIAGRADASIAEPVPAHIDFYPQLAAEELQALMAAASYIICRSGYTTLMDLAVLQKKAILIPTPGQTEQEYLARHLQQQGIFPAYPQADFSLDAALKQAALFPFHPLPTAMPNHRMENVVEEWLKIL